MNVVSSILALLVSLTATLSPRAYAPPSPPPPPFACRVQRNGVCALVPSSFTGVPFSSYRATCDAAGKGGSVLYCSSADCTPSTCTTAPFSSNSCQANAAVYGARSVEISCVSLGDCPKREPLSGAPFAKVKVWRGSAHSSLPSPPCAPFPLFAVTGCPPQRLARAPPSVRRWPHRSNSRSLPCPAWHDRLPALKNDSMKLN